MTDNWKTWAEPTEPSAVVWRDKDKGAGLSTAVRDGDLWYLTGRSFGRTWSELSAYIDAWCDGMAPRVVPLAEPERALAVPCPLCGPPAGILCCGRHGPRATPHASRIRSAEAAPEAPKPERVVVWNTGDQIDKLKPYMEQEGVEVRAERDGTVVTGSLSVAASRDLINVGGVYLSAKKWRVTVTAPQLVAPWWLVDRIEEGHVVSWTDRDGETYTIVWVWQSASNLAYWRDRWDTEADPTTWRVTDVHAAGGPKLIAGTP